MSDKEASPVSLSPDGSLRRLGEQVAALFRDRGFLSKLLPGKAQHPGSGVSMPLAWGEMNRLPVGSVMARLPQIRPEFIGVPLYISKASPTGTAFIMPAGTALDSKSPPTVDSYSTGFQMTEPGLRELMTDGANWFTSVARSAAASSSSSALSFANLPFFGSGSDGSTNISTGVWQLTKPQYFDTLTMSGTGQLDCNGFPLFARTLDLTAAINKAIFRAGTVGSGISVATASGLTSQLLGGSSGSSAGGAGGTAGNPGTQGTAYSGQTKLGNGGPGGTSGAGGAGNGGAVAGGAGRAGAGPILKSPQQAFGPIGALYVINDPELEDQLCGGVPGAGGSGGGGGTGTGGSGAGGGGAGGVLEFWAGNLITGASTPTGAISSHGGAALTTNVTVVGTNAGGGSGAGGGGGGVARGFIGKRTGAPVVGLVVANGGNGGNGQNGNGTGSPGFGGCAGGGGEISIWNLDAGTVTYLARSTAVGASGIGQLGGIAPLWGNHHLMAQTKTLHVPVTPGMREDISPHMAQPGQLSVADNVRFPISGEVESRRGTTALAVITNADVSYADIVGSDGPDFLQQVPGGFVFGSKGFGYRYDNGKNRVHAAGSYSNAVPYGRFATMAVEESALTLGHSTPWPLSTAVGGGYIAILRSAGSGQQQIDGTSTLRCQIFTEGGTLVTTIVTAAYSTGWVIYDGTQFVILGQQSSSGNTLKVDAALVTLASTGATLGSFVNVATLQASTSCWAAVPWSGQGWVLVYQSAATTATIQKLVGTTGGITQTFTTAAATSPLSIYADGTNVYVGWVDVAADNVAKARVYDTTLTLTSGGTVTIYTDAGQANLTLTPPLFGTSVIATSAFVAVGRAFRIGSTGSAATFTKVGTLSAAGVHTTVSDVAYNLFPTSAPFNNGMLWCRAQTPSSSSNYGNIYLRNVLVDFQNNRTSASDTFWRHRWPRIALAADPFADPTPGDYAGDVAYLHLCHPVQLTNTHWLSGMGRLVRSEQPTGGQAWGLALGEWLEYAIGATRDSRRFGNEVIVAGSPTLVGYGAFGSNNYTTPALSEPSTTNQADGIDLGFFIEPSVTSPAQSDTAAGALTVLGAYEYRTVVEWIDNVGRRWRSRPSRAQAVTMSGTNDTNTFTEADDFAWLRQGFSNVAAVSNIVKHYYRTTAGGSTFYRVTPPQGAPIASAGSSFVDTLADTVAATREILYTDGGVLGNDHPSSCRFLAITEDRVWLAGLWDETQLQSSKLLTPGEPPQFTDSDSFRVVLPDKCTGLAAQDGVLIAFCRTAIYAVQGGGPNDQGQGAWDSPRVVTRSNGCINGASIVETSLGVFFQSLRGIELLPRGLGEPQFVGAPVQVALGSSNIASASVVTTDNAHTVRFVLGTSYVLVFDLDTQAWSRDYYNAHTVKAICDTEQGAVIGTLLDVSYAFLLEGNSTVKDSTGNLNIDVASVLQWIDVRPFGIAGQGRFTGAIGLFDKLTTLSSPGYQSGNATLFVTVDRATDPGKAYDMATFNQPDYRKHAPLNDVGSACVLKLTTAANGWRFMGWTVELDDLGGGRRMAETEQG